MFHNIKALIVNIGAIILVLLLLALTLKQNHGHIICSWHLLLALAITIFAGTFNFWRLLKFKEAPISTIAAAAQGYVELYGVAKRDKPLTTPYQSIPCVWYKAWVYANFQDRSKDDDYFNHRLLNYEESHDSFILDDGSAQCLVNPVGAEVVYFETKTWRKNDHRYVEQYLPVGKYLYVIGQLDTRKEILDEKLLNQEVREVLRDMKTRPQQLRHRYDHNQSGQVDIHEWDKVRQDAIQQVKAKYAMLAHTGKFTLSQPATKQLFLISAKSPKALRQQYRDWLLIHMIFLGVLLSLCIKFS
jgi:hypothetical protein